MVNLFQGLTMQVKLWERFSCSQKFFSSSSLLFSQLATQSLQTISIVLFQQLQYLRQFVVLLQAGFDFVAAAERDAMDILLVDALDVFR